MARRQQRRPAYKPARGAPRDRTAEDAAVEQGARRLLTQYDARALASLVHDLRQLRDEADRVATDDPSPDALRHYRRANRELAEAERALQLAERAA